MAKIKIRRGSSTTKPKDRDEDVEDFDDDDDDDLEVTDDDDEDFDDEDDDEDFDDEDDEDFDDEDDEDYDDDEDDDEDDDDDEDWDDEDDEDYDDEDDEDWDDEDDEDYDEDEEDIPSISATIEDLPKKARAKIDQIFQEPDFMYSTCCLLQYCAKVKGANKEYFDVVIDDLCEFAGKKPEKYLKKLDLKSFDMKKCIENMKKLPSDLKYVIALIVIDILEEAEEDKRADKIYKIFLDMLPKEEEEEEDD